MKIKGITVLAYGMGLLLALGASWTPPPDECPMPPAPPAAATVAVGVQVVLYPDYIALCARAVNGTDDRLNHGAAAFRLDRWETGRWHDMRPKGIAVPWSFSSLGPGEFTERVVRESVERMRPGQYRLCFEYWLQPETRPQREACSEPFRRPDDP